MKNFNEKNNTNDSNENNEQKNIQSQKLKLSDHMKNIFKQLLFHNVGEVETKHLIKNTNFENELNSYHDILITELKKPINSKKKEHIRKLDVIIFALEKYKYFIRFKLFNKLNRSILRRCAKFFRYKKYKKGEYIFYMSQISDCFYGVLTGSVSIRGILTENYKIDLQDFENEEIDTDRGFFSSDIIQSYKKKKQISPNEIRANLEYEKTKILPGMCFGEWGIINNTVRAGSAYCLEETEVFYMTQEHFLQNLSQIFLNSLNHKKTFLNSIIPKLGLRLSLTVSKFYDFGDIIYTKNDESKFLYIIYQGEASFLYKFNENEMNNKKLRNFEVLSSMRKGCVFGKESLNKKIKFYENNIVCTQDFTVIYEIKTDLLEKEGLDLYLVEKLLEQQNEIVDYNFKLKNDLEKFIYKKFHRKTKSEILNEKYENIVNVCVQNQTKNYFYKINLPREIKGKFELLKPEFLNEIKSNKNIKKNYLTLNIKEENKNEFNINNKNFSTNKSLNFIKKNKNIFPSSQMLIYKNLSKQTKINKNNEKNSIFSYNSFQKGFSTNYQTNSSLNYNFFLTNIQNKTNYLSPLNRGKKIKKPIFLLPNLSFNLFKKKFDLNLKNNKFIGKTIKNFKNVKNKENFITGNYNVPLITFLLKKNNNKK